MKQIPLTVNTVFCADHLLKGMIRLSADFERFCEAARAGRKEHEFLESELVPSVRAAIDDVKRGGWKHVWRLDTCQLGKMLIQRNALLGCSSIRNCNGYPEDGVGTELALVWCAIEPDQKVINLFLLRHLEIRLDQCGRNCVVDVGNGLGDTFVGK
jgi:hypothetical protein